MQEQRERDRAKINGRAAFAGAAYIIGIGLIFLLERVGAPNGLVHALGPLFALAGLALLGLLTRATRVPSFFAADRAIPASYAGLSFAGIAAGLLLCLLAPGDSPLPLAGVAIGLCVGGLVTGPLLRATNASALSDLLATRFPHPLLRIYFAAIMFSVAALVAMAGFAAAVDAATNLFSLPRGAAVTMVALLLAIMLVPGGLAGLLWGAAASAGIVAFVLILPIAGQLFSGNSALASLFQDELVWKEPLARAWSSGDAGDPNVRFLVILASALAIAVMPPLSSPAIGSSSERQALRAGAVGMVFTALFAAAAFIDLMILPIPSYPMASGLKSSAVLLAALLLAASGIHSASRAWGTNAGRAYDRHAPLASQRLARSRILMLVAIGLCASLILRRQIDPKLPIFVAAALSLALASPAIALAFSTRTASIHAAAAILCSLATAGALAALDPSTLNSGRLMIGALCVSAAGFIGGWSIAIFSRRDREPPPVRRDFFIDAPLDPRG
jgi:Na+/proline symporter